MDATEPAAPVMTTPEGPTLEDGGPQPAWGSGQDARPDGWYIYMVKLLDSALRPPFERMLRGHGLTSAQYAALSVLNVRPGITSSELARRSFVRAQSMADTVAVLLEQSWVRREPDPVNARRLLLHPTAQGGQVLGRVRQDVTELQDRLLAGFDADRIAGLDRDLRQLRHNLQELNEATP